MTSFTRAIEKLIRRINAFSKGKTKKVDRLTNELNDLLKQQEHVDENTVPLEIPPTPLLLVNHPKNLNKNGVLTHLTMIMNLLVMLHMAYHQRKNHYHQVMEMHLKMKVEKILVVKVLLMMDLMERLFCQ